MQQLDSPQLSGDFAGEAYAPAPASVRRPGRRTVKSTPLRSLANALPIRGHGSKKRPRAIQRAIAAVTRGLDSKKCRLYKRLAALAPAGPREQIVAPAKGVPAQFKRHAKGAGEFSGRDRRSDFLGNLRAFLTVILRSMCARTGRIGRRMPGGGWQYATLEELDSYAWGDPVEMERSAARTRRMLSFCEAHGLIETIRQPTPVPEAGGEWRALPLKKRLTQAGAQLLGIDITFETAAAGKLRGAELQRELQIQQPQRRHVAEAAAAVPAAVLAAATLVPAERPERDPDPPPRREPGDLVAGLWAELAAKLAD
jgi:hypothetical protein